MSGTLTDPLKDVYNRIDAIQNSGNKAIGTITDTLNSHDLRLNHLERLHGAASTMRQSNYEDDPKDGWKYAVEIAAYYQAKLDEARTNY